MLSVVQSHQVSEICLPLLFLLLVEALDEPSKPMMCPRGVLFLSAHEDRKHCQHVDDLP